ncbi:hypothetical protein B0T18DRAFT_44004 [Schizothecium vesticola]|uniref:Uncharacterized protein n=1 Tax=Schizothecium vesticola TaxID=314040 RepID=A0AA40FBI3_9PEZI|nr:hypothetical protein B0T18DRAFT_44004 [Schizothecium vesticola]
MSGRESQPFRNLLDQLQHLRPNRGVEVLRDLGSMISHTAQQTGVLVRSAATTLGQGRLSRSGHTSSHYQSIIRSRLIPEMRGGVPTRRSRWCKKDFGDALGSDRRAVLSPRGRAPDQTQYSYYVMPSSGRLPRPSSSRPLNSTASVGRACTLASCIACRGDLHRQEQEHGTPPGLGLAVYYDALLVSRRNSAEGSSLGAGGKDGA